jgi:hypothetical protein
MNSSTEWPTVFWNEGLPRIIIVGVVGVPISPLLLRGPSSMPPKQKLSEQIAPEVCHIIRKSHPVPFCFTAKDSPDWGSTMVGVSFHEEGEYAPFTLTAMVDL